ncbi:uncharacterized protein PHACADRAFT_185036 [Phanerochaete carnosa HHB-10118-sp]|uniref:CST complex subunit Stn1 N-terminal domain-containing protein n=1 Tax=Phanerochaete carnosa (strain HHB-10118-sp) TaxID=650164 RepID=K5VRD4_PHACS|nr:uncharacterized protein PHACADRAFT_185036 [Phanerochaete carnosa HHB-10118-sp]EKM54048.1 hypothetical protein PHACADRAFT_185036 [Phanerochaete carnosa HHB-10118-sp]
MSHNVNDFAQVVRIDALTTEHVSRKLRIVGRIRLYDAENALVCIADEQDTLLIDISLCLSGFRSFSWLREVNTPLMAIGYLERLDLPQHDDGDVPTLVLRALLIQEQRALDLNVWNRAIDAHKDAEPVSSAA